MTSGVVVFEAAQQGMHVLVGMANGAIVMGYGPSSVVGLLASIVVVLLLLGRI